MRRPRRHNGPRRHTRSLSERFREREVVRGEKGDRRGGQQGSCRLVAGSPPHHANGARTNVSRQTSVGGLPADAPLPPAVSAVCENVKM